MSQAVQSSGWRRCCVGIALSILGGAAVDARAADLTLMVEPFYPPQRAAEVYQPLADYLSTATGNRVELVTPRNYHFFWRDVRNNTPIDLVIAEPPITDYRAQRFGAIPLVHTAEKTVYTLLASDQLQNPTLQTLVGRNIVTLPSPSLGFALLLELFPNPVAQPNILSSASSWNDGPEIVFAGEADAAIVPSWLMQQYPNLLPLSTSREFPGIALSASSGLDPAVRDAIRDALLKLHEDPTMYGVLNELGISRYEAATAEEYRGMEQMLKGFYGYQ